MGRSIREAVSAQSDSEVFQRSGIPVEPLSFGLGLEQGRAHERGGRKRWIAASMALHRSGADNLRQLREIVGAIEMMTEAAAECYEVETDRAFILPAGSRASLRAQATGAVFEARQLLEQHDRETVAKSKVE